MGKISILAFVLLSLSGCMSEDVLYYDGVTTAAGDAIAANTAMQMIDPWPAGVEQTRFSTPSLRPKPAGGASSHGETSTATTASD